MPIKLTTTDTNSWTVSTIELVLIIRYSETSIIGKHLPSRTHSRRNKSRSQKQCKEALSTR